MRVWQTKMRGASALELVIVAAIVLWLAIALAQAISDVKTEADRLPDLVEHRQTLIEQTIDH